MDKQTSRRGREPLILGKEDAPRAVVLFHGYTASTGDFNDLPEKVAEMLDARVVVPLLPGHGTKVEDLLPLHFDTFLDAADQAVHSVARPGRQIAFGGHSFGSYLAIILAEKYRPAGLFTTVIPYRLRFPYSSFIGRAVSHSKPLWKKRLPPDEWESRAGYFFYDQMPGRGLSLVNEGNKRIRKLRGALDCPTLAIHARGDHLAHPEETLERLALIGKHGQENLILENDRHSIYFSPEDRDTVTSTIIDFLERSFESEAHG